MKQYFSRNARLLVVIFALVIGGAAHAQEGNSANIALTMTDDRQAVKPGTEITYQIVASNNGTSDLKSVKLVMHIPDYVVPSSTLPQSQPDPNERTITWNNLNLTAGSQQTFSVRAHIAAETPSGLVIRTMAEITGSGTKSNAADTTTVDTQPFVITDQAATTTAPVIANPPPHPVAPTAPTGTASSIIYIAATMLGALGLLRSRRLA